MTTQTLALDMIPGSPAPVLHVSQYDRGQTWNFNIHAGNDAFTIPDGSVVDILGTKPDRTIFQYACTYSGSTVTAIEQQQMTTASGQVQAEIRITKSGNLIGSLNFVIAVEPAAMTSDAIVSGSYLPMIEAAAELAEQMPDIVAQIEEWSEDAEAWANGTRNGTPVGSSDPAYQKNARYYVDNCIGMITDAQWAQINTILA